MSAAASSAAVSARFPPPPPPDDVEVEVQENARVKRTAAQEERRERLRLWSHNRDARTTAHTAAVQGTVVSTLPIPDAVHHYLLLLPPGLHPAVSVAGGVEDKRRKVVKRKGRKKGRKRSGSREKRISLSQPSRVAATVAAARKPVPVPVLTTAAVQPVPAPNAPTVALQEKLANLEMKMNAIERGALLSRARAAVGDGDDHSSDSLASLL